MCAFSKARILIIAGITAGCLVTSQLPEALASESVTAKENLQKLLKTGSCQGCYLSEINFTRMELSGANLENADLSLCKFALANLSSANLRGAKLNGATFGGADLADADLSGADVRGAVFDGAYLGGAKFDGDFIATKPYANIGIDDIEKKVYVESQETPKKSPETGEVKVSKRRDFEEPPPVATSSSVPQKQAESIAPVAAPEMKTVKPLSVAMVEITESTEQTSIQKNTVAAKEEDSEASNNGKASVKTESIAASTAADEKQKVKVAGKIAAVQLPPEPEPEEKKEPAVEKKEPIVVHADELQKLTDTNKCYGCDLSSADLAGKNFKNADLELANLAHTDLHEVDFRKANLKGANLEGADLRKADLRGADLYRANLTGADLTDARVDDAQFDDAVLEGVTGLEQKQE